MRLDSTIPLPFSEATVRARLLVRDIPDPDGIEAERLKAAIQDFESLLIEQMLKQMRNSIPDGGLFSVNRGREIFNEMLDGEYARLMSSRGGFGLAEFMLSRMGPK
ncbi:MAG: rod-binding protein [SAR324 cluster bacterium]|nr:rod-binding protein [SAR324 cluster bacterium]